MLRTLRNSVAIIAATAALAAPLAAQTTAQPAAPAAPATPPAVVTAPTAPATVPAPATTATTAAVPQALAALGITDATVTQGRKGGQKAEGTLPGGVAYRAALDGQGQLRMLRVTDDAAALPSDVVNALVPEAVRANALFAEFASVKGVGIKGAPPAGAEAPAAGAQGQAPAQAQPAPQPGVMIFGTDTANEPLRAAFSQDGTLQMFGRGEMRGKHDGMRGGDDDRRGGRHGKGGHGDKADRGGDRGGDRGEQRRGDRGEQRGMMGQGGPGMGPGAGQGAAAGAPMQLDDASVQAILTAGGYTQPGAITRNGPATSVEAVNANGEPVTVTINPRGVITQETAR